MTVRREQARFQIRKYRQEFADGDAGQGARIQPAGRPLDGLPKASLQGRSRAGVSEFNHSRGVSMEILDEASTAATPSCAPAVEFMTKLAALHRFEL